MGDYAGVESLMSLRVSCIMPAVDADVVVFVLKN